MYLRMYIRMLFHYHFLMQYHSANLIEIIPNCRLDPTHQRLGYQYFVHVSFQIEYSILVLECRYMNMKVLTSKINLSMLPTRYFSSIRLSFSYPICIHVSNILIMTQIWNSDVTVKVKNCSKTWHVHVQSLVEKLIRIGDMYQEANTVGQYPLSSVPPRTIKLHFVLFHPQPL